MKNKNSSLTKNYIYNLIYQLFTFLPLLIITPYLSHVLGAQKIGIYSFTTSILSYFVLFGCLGVNLYGQRQIAATRNNLKKMTNTFYELFFLKTIFILLSSLVYICFCFSDSVYGVYYKILIFQLLFNIFDITWFYQGIEDFKTISVQTMIVKIVLTLSIFLFIKDENSLLIYFIIMVISYCLTQTLLLIHLKENIGKFNIKEINIFKHFKNTIIIFIPQIAIQIYTVLDKTMIGWILNDMKEVGYYEQAQKLIHLCLMVITSFGTVMVPRISNLYAKQKQDELNEKINQSFKVVSFIAFPMCFGLMAITNCLVPWFFGEQFISLNKLLPVLSLLFLAIGFNNITGIQYAISTSHQQKFTVSVIVGALINIVLNLILIPNYGALGASIASVVSETVIFIVQIFYFKSIFDFKKIFLSNIKYFYFSIIMAIVVYIVGMIFSSNIFTTVLQIAIGLVIYFVLLLISKDDFLGQQLNIIKTKFIKH